MANKIWLCSDWHFNHAKPFLTEPRGFSPEEVDKMNEEIVANHNARVAPDDIVYCLGDCFFGPRTDEMAALLKSLNGKKYLAVGNHDTDARIKWYEENEIFEDIQFGYRLRYKKRTWLLTHYPTRVENFDKVNVLNVHGHTHSPVCWDSAYPYNYNVSMEANSLCPMDIDDILQDFKEGWSVIKNSSSMAPVEE